MCQKDDVVLSIKIEASHQGRGIQHVFYITQAFLIKLFFKLYQNAIMQIDIQNTNIVIC